MAAIEKLTRFFAIMFPSFFPREKPISRKAKPACMNMTRQPAMNTQRELMATSAGNLPATDCARSSPVASAAVGTANVASSPAPTPAAQRVLRIDPPLWNSIGAEDLARPAAHHCPRVEDSPGRDLPAVET